MANVNDQDLLDEIRFDIKVKDLRKAQLVLAALEHVKPDTQKKALFEVSRADAEFAIPLLAGVFVNSPDIAMSFPQLKETMYSKILSAPQVIPDLLAKTKDPKSRAFLAEVAGEIRLKAAVPTLMDLLKGQADDKTTKSVISALGLIGDPGTVDLISGFLNVSSVEVVGASVRALGELATSEAIQKLSEKLGDIPDLDPLIIDILSGAQTPEALEKLNATLASPHAHIRTAAKQKLSEIGAMSVRVLIKNLNHENNDLVIHSLNVLGDIGDVAAVSPIRNLLHNDPEDANVRFAAYETLGRLPVGKGTFTLAAGLEDPVDNVRASAAKAIDRNYNGVLAGGLRNLTRSANGNAKTIIETIIASQCSNIFLDLLDEDFFLAPAIDYINRKAHPEVRAHFATLLADAGRRDLAGQIAAERAVKQKTGIKIFAVDDSRMILNIYRTILHNLGCKAFTFEFPKEALERIRNEKPDVILTDLNMPSITGIDLTADVRKVYDRENLPIIMVTTQAEGTDDQAAYAAGVNGIIRKPFTESIIAAALSKFAGVAKG